MIFAGFADISIVPLLLVAGVVLFASVIGGLPATAAARWNMRSVLVPLIGADCRADHRDLLDLHQYSRFVAPYVRYADRRRARCGRLGRGA